MKGRRSLLCFSDECLSTLILPALGVVDRIKLSMTCKRLHSLSASTPWGDVTLRMDEMQHCFHSDCSKGRSRSMLHFILQAAPKMSSLTFEWGDRFDSAPPDRKSVMWCSRYASCFLSAHVQDPALLTPRLSACCSYCLPMASAALAASEVQVHIDVSHGEPVSISPRLPHAAQYAEYC